MTDKDELLFFYFILCYWYSDHLHREIKHFPWCLLLNKQLLKWRKTADITQRNNEILIIFQDLPVSNKPCNGLLRHNDFCSLQSSGVTWHMGMQRHPRARGCEKQIVNPEKGKKCNKRQSATLHTSCQGLIPSSFLSPLHHTKSGKFIGGRWLSGLQLSYGLMCYSAMYYITICLR